MEFEE
jgi:hypothetical protein